MALMDSLKSNSSTRICAYVIVGILLGGIIFGAQYYFHETFKTIQQSAHFASAGTNQKLPVDDLHNGHLFEDLKQVRMKSTEPDIDVSDIAKQHIQVGMAEKDALAVLQASGFEVVEPPQIKEGDVTQYPERFVQGKEIQSQRIFPQHAFVASRYTITLLVKENRVQEISAHIFYHGP